MREKRIAVEPLPSDIRQEGSASASPYRPAPLRARLSASDQRRLEDVTHLKLDAPAQTRLGLQRGAHRNLRRHVRRATVRFFSLLVLDLGAFGIMRGLIRAVRDGEVLGPWLSTQLRSALPAGYLNGWQFAAALFLGLLVLENYGPGDRRRDPRRLFLACALAGALPLWTMLWTRGLEVVLIQYTLTVVLVWAGVAAERISIDQLVRWVRNSERDATDTVFVGSAAECKAAAAGPAFGPSSEYRPIGFVDTGSLPAHGALGEFADLPTLLAASGAEVVVVCGLLNDDQFHLIVDAALAGGCQVLATPRVMGIVGVHPTTIWRSGQPLVELTRPALKGRQLFVKRTLDVLLSAVALVVASPLLAIVWLAIKLDSRGPALFGHQRLGMNGRTFRCYKFRSMRWDAESRLRSDADLYAKYVANSYKLPEHQDPRLTRVGRVLRRSSIDELPQLINVLMGDMSFVGPRPIVPEELAQYGHGAAVFLSLQPGITGAWQVNGRSRVGYPDRVDLELEYVRNWSLGRDLWILFKTIPAVLGRRGAH